MALAYTLGHLRLWTGPKSVPLVTTVCAIHGTALLQKSKHKMADPSEKAIKWLEQNEQIYPPQEPWEERRPAWVCHVKTQIKYSPKKMQLLSFLVRGLAVDDALVKLAHIPKKGAQIMKEVIEEAQQIAVKDHNVEYKSNLWIADSYAGKGTYVKGLRRHARARFGIVHYYYCHYFVRLVEGPPPENYHGVESGHQKLQKYLYKLRNRTITKSL